MAVATPRLSTWESLRAVFRSWRLLSVALLSFVSGLPLGLIWIAVPAWMTRAGVDIKVIGLFSLAQAPWSFKLLWSPAMDRYPLPFLGRRRGYMLISLLALAGLSVGLALVADQQQGVVTIGILCTAIAFASATFDIAYDAYTVEVLRPEEQGLAVGARVAFYRAAMFVGGGVAITRGADWGWPAINLALALAYVPFALVVWYAPEPEAKLGSPKSLTEAVWGPFVAFLGRHRALEILAFVVLYKLSDQLTQALTRPFLIQTGFDDRDVGEIASFIGLVATVVGAVLGGGLTPALGLGRALWIFGFLQLFSNLGYAVLAQAGPSRPIMYFAHAFEHLSSGLGTGAFGVLLLRLTEKRFSATQYGLLSSLFTIPRILAGPVAGVAADAIGWRDFFIGTVFAGLPGLLMLGRFVPWNARELQFEVAPLGAKAPLGRQALALRALAGGLTTGVLSLLALATRSALGDYRTRKAFDLQPELLKLLAPSDPGGWLTLGGVLLFAITGGLLTAATAQARRAPPASE